MIKRLLVGLLVLAFAPANAATFVADLSSFDDWIDTWQTPDPTWSLEAGPSIAIEPNFATGFYFLRFNPAGVVSGDVEVLAKVRYATTGAGRGVVVVCANNGSGGTDFESYFALVSNGTDILVGRNDATAEVDYADSAFIHSADTDYWVRLQKNSTNVRMRIWEDGDAEPGTWTTFTDTTLSGGYVGLYSRNGGQSSTWSYFSVGTGGDPAPSPSTGAAQINALQNVGAGFGPHKSQQLGGILQ